MKMTVQFEMPYDDEEFPKVIMAIEDALPEEATGFEWDTEGD